VLLSGLNSGIAIFLCPLLGLLLDKKGNKMWACVGAGVVSAIAYLLLAYAKSVIHPVIPLVMLAVCMSFVPTVLRSAVPAMVPPVFYGTAYGLYSVAESAGAVVGHAFTGYVRDKHQDYRANLLVFAALAMSAAAMALGLSIYDKQNDGSLNKPSIHHHAEHLAPDAPPTEMSDVENQNGVQNGCPCICHTTHVNGASNGDYPSALITNLRSKS